MAWVMTATCPSPTVPSSSAAPNIGSRAGRCPPLIGSCSRVQRAARTRPAASPAVIRRVSRSSTRVEDTDNWVARSVSSTSPAHRTCAAYTDRPIDSSSRPTASSSGCCSFQNCASRNARTPDSTAAATDSAASRVSIGVPSMPLTLQPTTDSPRLENLIRTRVVGHDGVTIARIRDAVRDADRHPTRSQRLSSEPLPVRSTRATPRLTGTGSLDGWPPPGVTRDAPPMTTARVHAPSSASACRLHGHRSDRLCRRRKCRAPVHSAAAPPGTGAPARRLDRHHHAAPQAQSARRPTVRPGSARTANRPPEPMPLCQALADSCLTNA